MIRWTVAVALLTVSSFYLYVRYARVTTPPLPPLTRPEALARPEPRPFLTVDELRRIRQSLDEPDPGVRWAAMELLYTIKDPRAPALIERMLARETDPELRLRAVELLRTQPHGFALGGLLRALEDADTSVRLAALRALGDVGDPAATPWITERLKDSEPAVREEALRTLGKFQDKRKVQYAELTQKLRREYEDAVARAATRANQ